MYLFLWTSKNSNKHLFYGIVSCPYIKKLKGNLLLGEVNGDRSNYRYGADIPKVGQYGQCKFEVDFKAKRAYPKEDIRGDIARIYFYMSDKYNINLSKQERRMMEVRNKQDPIDEWERVKNERVEKLQGNANPYIK